MQIHSLNIMKGENGEVGTFAGSCDPSEFVATVVQAKKNDLAANYSKSASNDLSMSRLHESAEKFSKLVQALPDATDRMSAFSSLRTMILSASSRTSLAKAYSDSMNKNGHELTSSQFLSGKPMMLNGGTVYNDSILFSKSDCVSLINNLRSNLAQIFVDKTGSPTSDSQKYINGLLKPIERSLEKYNATSAVSTAVLELVNPTLEKLTNKFQDYAIGQAMVAEQKMGPSLANVKGMSR